MKPFERAELLVFLSLLDVVSYSFATAAEEREGEKRQEVALKAVGLTEVR